MDSEISEQRILTILNAKGRLENKITVKPLQGGGK